MRTPLLSYLGMFHRPHHLPNQHFGNGLTKQELINNSHQSVSNYHPALTPYLRNWHFNIPQFEKDHFEVHLDVHQFAPEEIKVKVVDGSIVVLGEHEEKEDEHGFVFRKFVRRYSLPKEYKLEAVSSNLSSDGVLTVSAPKLEEIEDGEKTIPITFNTGLHKIVHPKH